MTDKSPDSGKQKAPEKINWPALIWRTCIRLIPFILLLYYLTYEPDIQSKPTFSADSLRVDSLMIDEQ